MTPLSLALFISMSQPATPTPTASEQNHQLQPQVDTIPAEDSNPQTPPGPTFEPRVRRIGVQLLDPVEDSDTENNNSGDVEMVENAPTPASETPAKAPSLEQVTAAPTAPTPNTSKKPALELPDIELGAQAFVRGEAVTGQELQDGEPMTQVQQRIRLTGGLRWRSLSLFTQLQDTRNWGSEVNTTTSIANVDLHQGYFEMGAESRSHRYRSFFRIGRQEISIGRQRLIGALDWAVTARAFDALRVFTALGDMEFDAFWAVLRGRGIVDGGATGLRYSNGLHLGGLRIAYRPTPWIQGEILGLLHHDDQGARATSEDIGNIGLRIWGEPLHGLRYDAEGNFQFGERLGRVHRAWAAAADLQYQHRWTSRWGLGGKAGFAAASGQDDSEKSTSFFNFYPTNHIHYGLMDLFGWNNILDYEAAAIVSVADMLDLQIGYHFFQLHTPDAPWTNATGAEIAPSSPGNDKRSLGSEIDFQATYQPVKPFFLQLGYGLFIPTERAYELVASPADEQSIQQRLFLWLKVTL